jgi:hypothetical protein
MRVLPAVAALAFLAVSAPLGSASAAMPVLTQAVTHEAGVGVVQADWNGRPDWHHHHWRHEWRDHWRPERHPDWHRHWHHGWDRPYGYQY